MNLGERFGLRTRLLLLSAALGVFLAADRLLAAGAERDAPEVAIEGTATEMSPAHPRPNKGMLTFAFGMLAAILFGGTLLLALVVLWGNRTRRLARTPLPPVSKLDELWFLRPKKGAEEPDLAPPGDCPATPPPDQE